MVFHLYPQCTLEQLRLSMNPPGEPVGKRRLTEWHFHAFFGIEFDRGMILESNGAAVETAKMYIICESGVQCNQWIPRVLKEGKSCSVSHKLNYKHPKKNTYFCPQ